jgi:hypothetical protein
MIAGQTEGGYSPWFKLWGIYPPPPPSVSNPVSYSCTFIVSKAYLVCRISLPLSSSVVTVLVLAGPLQGYDILV